jgi:hypothetical protein
MPGTDKIIAAAGLDPAGLAATVAEWRERSFHMETVLADHFDVEELAATIEILATELAHLNALATDGDSALAHVIRQRSQASVPTPPACLDSPGLDGPWTQRLIFGYPLLRRFSRSRVDLAAERLIHEDVFVHTETGAWTALADGESITGACARLTREQEPVAS